MQRISQGRKVPALAMDVFTGETTNVTGKLYLTLNHTPKSLNDIVIGYGYNTISQNRVIAPKALVGKVLEARVKKLMYDKADTPTNTDVGSVGGAGNHSHVITYTTSDAAQNPLMNEPQPAITVIYRPA